MRSTFTTDKGYQQADLLFLVVKNLRIIGMRSKKGEKKFMSRKDL